MRRRSSTRSSSGTLTLKGRMVAFPVAALGSAGPGPAAVVSVIAFPPMLKRTNRWTTHRSSGTCSQPLCRHGARDSPSLVRAARRSHPPVASATGQTWPGGAPTGTRGLQRPGGGRIAGQDPVELGAGGDGELGEDLGQGPPVTQRAAPVDHTSDTGPDPPILVTFTPFWTVGARADAGPGLRTEAPVIRTTASRCR